MVSAQDMAATHKLAFAQDRPWSADEFGALLTQRGVFACGDARAFALVRVTVDEAELLTIATHPAHQRQGLARALMGDWHARAAAMGAIRAILEVAADNAPARRLYDDSGYTECARRPGYYARVGSAAEGAAEGAHVDAILMDRPLP